MFDLGYRGILYILLRKRLAALFLASTLFLFFLTLGFS